MRNCANLEYRIESAYLSFFHQTIIQMLTMHEKKWYITNADTETRVLHVLHRGPFESGP